GGRSSRATGPGARGASERSRPAGRIAQYALSTICWIRHIMSRVTRRSRQRPDRPLYVLHGQIKTPPMSSVARVEVGYLVRRVQQGGPLSLPASRPMPEIGRNCHELRVEDSERQITWRVIYLLDEAAILVLEVFEKKSRATPETVKRACQERLRRYLDARGG